MDRIDAMRAFLAVADKASFAEAARSLRASPAAMTRAVAQLEQDLGLTLLHRTTRSVRLTERGALYAEKTRAVLAEIEAARSLVRGEGAEPRGVLGITAPVLFGRLHVMPIAEALTERHPELRIRLSFLDRVVHLAEEGFDAAVRIGPLRDSALLATKLTEVRRVTVASPGYLARHGTPASPGDLHAHKIVSYDGLGSTDEWRFGAPARAATVKVEPSLSVNCAEAAIDAIERGRGIGRLLSYQVRNALGAERLVTILDDFAPPPMPVSLLYPASRRSSANLRAFVAEAQRYFAGSEL